MSGLHRSSSAPLKNGLPPQELLDDLCSRFVLNVPKEDQQSFERILFLVEYAHWFYEDNTVEKNPSLKSFTLKEFTSLMFNSCEVLKPYVPHIDDIFKDFTSYKVRVPVTGAIILDKAYERCLLVKGWKGTSWSFPRGKKNKDEEDHACAIREVLEETGFDVSELLDKDEYLEVIFGQQRVRLYIIAGVSDDTSFAPQTKKEISSYCPPVKCHMSVTCWNVGNPSIPLEIAWHRLDDLQPASDEVISRSVTGLKLYMVTPFLKSLKTWIAKHAPATVSKSDASRRVHAQLEHVQCAEKLYSVVCRERKDKLLPQFCLHWGSGLSVWKAKNNSGGSSSAMVEIQHPKTAPDTHVTEKGPGKTLRNFNFDTSSIFRAMESGFSA
uniref:Nudix hydrolase domain-containing protein n=1 Tax=Chenopodium quinoa TaxID=63459 RepID=A0A803MZB4_CHEQI